MSLDFPTAPIEGQQHTQNGTAWTYSQGAWVVGDATGNTTEIVEDGAGYFVAGDTLIQYGKYLQTTSGNETITFPVAYDAGDIPVVTAGVNYNNTNTELLYAHAIGLITETDFRISKRRAQQGGSVVATAVDGDWIAIGPAPLAMRKPKEVIGGSGGGDVEVVKETSGSYQIGSKLVQWAVVTGSNATWTYPIAFASAPVVTATPNVDGANGGYMARLDNLTNTSVQIACFTDGGTLVDLPAQVVAIGDVAPEDALPTVVIGNGVTEFIDPTGVASWRVIGSVLEAWGTTADTSTSSKTVIFPRAFASKPAITVAAADTSLSDGNMRAAAVNEDTATATQCSVKAYNPSNNSAAARAVIWYAIGQVAP